MMSTANQPKNDPNTATKPLKLKWISRKDRKPSPRKLRPRFIPKTNQPNTQKTIDTFFSVSPKRKHEQSPVKNTPTTSTTEDLYLSPSARLDSLVPKVEDILRARQHEEEMKKIHALITESSKRFLEGLNSCTTNQLSEEPRKSLDFKSCKHLTKTQLNRRFNKDLKFIDDLFYGRVPNKRYELFKKDTPRNNGTEKDLRVNDINIAFTQDQLIHIVSLFRERYDNGKMYKYSDFYFKVLLPEYCLKIYSDVYKMTNQEVLKYLRNVPIPAII